MRLTTQRLPMKTEMILVEDRLVSEQDGNMYEIWWYLSDRGSKSTCETWQHFQYAIHISEQHFTRMAMTDQIQSQLF